MISREMDHDVIWMADTCSWLNLYILLLWISILYRGIEMTFVVHKS